MQGACMSRWGVCRGTAAGAASTAASSPCLSYPPDSAPLALPAATPEPQTHHVQPTKSRLPAAHLVTNCPSSPKLPTCSSGSRSSNPAMFSGSPMLAATRSVTHVLHRRMADGKRATGEGREIPLRLLPPVVCHTQRADKAQQNILTGAAISRPSGRRWSSPRLGAARPAKQTLDVKAKRLNGSQAAAAGSVPAALVVRGVPWASRGQQQGPYVPLYGCTYLGNRLLARRALAAAQAGGQDWAVSGRGKQRLRLCSARTGIARAAGLPRSQAATKPAAYERPLFACSMK